MIKFFRHIRQNLIMENKTGKYFKYAFGEIILVVIGILIALQINNWNTSRLNDIKEKQYLNNIIDDIKTQRLLVEDQVTHNSKMRQQCEKALIHLSSNHRDADSLNVYLTDITRKKYEVNDTTFKDLKSSGNILLIKDSDLKKKIISFYKYLDYSSLVIQISNETSIAEFRDLLVTKNVVNMNYTDSLKVAGGIDFSLKSIEIPWAKKLQEDKMNDKDYLLMLLNHISQRGRTSSVHLDIMQSMALRIENMESDIENYLEL